MKHPLLLPLLAQVALVFLVWLKLLHDRVSEIREKRIHPERLAHAADTARLLQRLSSAENFANLAELPVLFYAACLLAFALGVAETGALLPLAWLFVLSRYAHSLIHCTYNRVLHRFYAYVLGGVCLLSLWAVLAARIAGAG